MKSRGLCLLCLMVIPLITAGCSEALSSKPLQSIPGSSNNETELNNSENSQTASNTDVDIDSPSGFASSSHHSSLLSGENVQYSDYEIQVKYGSEAVIISPKESFPSEPVISPDAQRMAYIAPFEFEMPGEVWLYSIGQQEPVKTLTSEDFPSDKSPNRLLWLNDEHLLILIGNKHGTIPSNRDIFVYSLQDNSLEHKLELGPTEHISSVSLNSSQQLELEIETYDSNFMEFTARNVQYPLEQFIN
ncbi:hypothetical protein M3231_08310 [Neobacillus mesonae]|nr:hypothetical protein [Neobacillus mesonae]